MCGRLDLRIQDVDLARSLDGLKLQTLMPTPMQHIPILTDQGLHRGLWSFPKRGGGLHIHARIEEGRTTWASAWNSRRGVVPVAGWWEDHWHVTGPDMFPAVLTSHGALGLRAVVVTQPPVPYARHIERPPIPLTNDGAADWLGGYDPQDQVSDLQVEDRPYKVHALPLFNQN